MLTEKQIQIAEQLLSTSLLTKVYHSVSMVRDNRRGDELFPAFSKGAEEEYCGPDDTKGRFAYIRQTGAVQKYNESLASSETKGYRMYAPCRIVIFNDKEKMNFESLIRKFLKPVFSADVSLTSYNNNAFELMKQESPLMDFDFDATTFYLAIDIKIFFDLSVEDCEDANCKTYPNPICS